ncbi:hypothetical protein ACFQT0_31480 [Hymenobacter humi]|uniref:Uncharacterized protein n=1 Tax=Hymenobacter humi TaxID=1411620 RepID=A0ABW2UD25_9BACT
MPYLPRPETTQACAHCGQLFAARHLRRKYCCNSCNVLASYARTGRRAAGPSKADLEAVVQALLALTPPAPASPDLAPVAAQATRVAAIKGRLQDEAEADGQRATLAAQEQAVRLHALKAKRPGPGPAERPQ